MKIKSLIAILFLLLSSAAQAADVRGLTEIFWKNYDNFYQYGNCGGNIARLVEAAKEKRLDLSNAYVLNIVGAGFLETSGFYTRSKMNQWKMLGYFHVVLVADGYVFDFDLGEPLVLKLDEYIRLQFTPPQEPFKVGGNAFFTSDDLKYWTATTYDVQKYNFTEKPIETGKYKLTDLVPLARITSLKRLR